MGISFCLIIVRTGGHDKDLTTTPSDGEKLNGGSVIFNACGPAASTQSNSLDNSIQYYAPGSGLPT